MNRIVIAGCSALAFMFFFMNWVFVHLDTGFGVFSSWESGLGMLKGSEDYPGSPFALIPLLASLVGTGLYFVKDQRGILGSAIAGMAGVVSMAWIRIVPSIQMASLKDAKLEKTADFGTALASEMVKHMSMKFTFIFYATIVLFAASAVISFLLYKNGASTNTNSGSGAMPLPSSNSFCTKCGAANKKGTAFCTSCGEKLPN